MSSPGHKRRLPKWWPWVAFPAAALAINALVFQLLRESPAPITTTTIEVGSGPQNVAVGHGAVWVSGFGDVALSKIDPATERVSAQRLTGAGISGRIAIGGDSVWVGSIQGDTITRVAPDAVTERQSIKVGETPQSLASGFGRVWVAALDAGELIAVDLVSGEVIERYSPGHEFLSAVAVGYGSVWVTDIVDDVLLEIDPATGEVVRTIEMGSSPSAIAIGEGSVWVSHFGDGTVYRVDPESGEVLVRKPLALDGGLAGIAVGDGFVWVSSSKDDALVQLDPSDNSEERRIAVGDNPQGVAFGEGSVWVVNQDDGTLTRVRL